MPGEQRGRQPLPRRLTRLLGQAIHCCHPSSGRNPVRVRDGPATVSQATGAVRYSPTRPTAFHPGRGPRRRRRSGMTRIALVSTSDTDLLSARASGADYLYVNPSKAAHTEMADGLRRGGSDRGPDPRLAEEPVHRVRPDPRRPASRWWCSAASRPRTRADGAVHRADRRRRRGARLPGPGRAGEPAPSCTPSCPTPCCSPAIGFEPPAEQPVWGALTAPGAGRPRQVARRASASSSTAPSTPPGTPRTSRRWPTRSMRPAASAYPIFATSLRDAPADLLDYLGTLDALVTTVLAAGGTRPATALGRGGRRGLGRPRPRRAGHPDPAGPLPDLGPRLLGRPRTRG